VCLFMLKRGSAPRPPPLYYKPEPQGSRKSNMATPINTPNAPNAPTPPPPEVYAIFCGGIDQAMAQKIVNNLTAASVQKVKHVHLLFQSAGGYVGDGVFLYNLFRSIPVELTLYNVGQISSAGVVAYLGAKRRKTSASRDLHASQQHQ
jgi:ATP-dependent protease ClpP protease subunit